MLFLHYVHFLLFSSYREIERFQCKQTNEIFFWYVLNMFRTCETIKFDERLNFKSD
jgi:hypothetical protein